MRGSFVFLLLMIFACGACGDSSPSTVPSGSFALAVLGDAPYYWWEENQFRRLLGQLDEAELAAVVHVGDIFWRPCSDAMMQRRRDQLDLLDQAVIYTPGDNEWADCWEPRVGGYRPRERLDHLRQVFFAEPGFSLGRHRLRLETQAAEGEFPEYVENVRWVHDQVLLLTVHLVGSKNYRDPFPGRDAADDAESVRRTAAAADWLRRGFARARAAQARAVVIALHANPDFEAPAQDSYRHAYDPFLQTLEDEVAAYERPVLVVQGDNHEYLVGHPLVRRSTGMRLDNLTRLQVPGSPEVGWVRVLVSQYLQRPFQVEIRRIARWLIW